MVQFSSKPFKDETIWPDVPSLSRSFQEKEFSPFHTRICLNTLLHAFASTNLLTKPSHPVGPGCSGGPGPDPRAACSEPQRSRVKIDEQLRLSEIFSPATLSEVFEEFVRPAGAERSYHRYRKNLKTGWRGVTSADGR